VVLNASGAEAPPFKLVRGAAGDPKEIRVTVQGPQGTGVPHIDVILPTAAGDVSERTGQDGAALFPEIRGAKSVKFVVPVYDVEAGPFPLNPEHNEFIFEINGEAITRVPFKDERLKVGDRVLEMRFWNKERPMQYRRS
jgi:hypothetical protein